MADETGRFGWLMKVSKVAMILGIVLSALLVVLGVAGIVKAVPMLAQSGGLQVLGTAVVTILIGLLGAALSVVGYGVVAALVRNEAGVQSAAEYIRRIESVAEETHRDIHKLTDLSQLSDQAKSLIFRERELEAFRETIHADLMVQDYQSAESLVEAIEERFGYADEAARLRKEIQDSRDGSLEEKIDAAISRVDSILARHDWTQAAREARRIVSLFPDNEKVADLPERIARARNARKRELLQEYGEAVRKNDIDGSIATLRELDLYLTPQEAAAMQESARGVLRAKLHNLGVQFAICVTDQRWTEAIEVGEQIISEYPNSRMASEVRSKMDQLRSRAGV
ncbi:MAG: hypothetical protein ACOCZU_00945 [Planctomycetota bacterium]